jgi:hypothetical protein
VRITYTFSSALSGATEYELLIDEHEWPRERLEGVPAKKSPFDFGFGTYVACDTNEDEDVAALYRRKQKGQVALKAYELKKLADALRGLRLNVAKDSNQIAEVTDGWSGKLEIDSIDFQCHLKWFLTPPKEWQGLEELVAVIESFDASRRAATTGSS